MFKMYTADTQWGFKTVHVFLGLPCPIFLHPIYLMGTFYFGIDLVWVSRAWHKVIEGCYSCPLMPPLSRFESRPSIHSWWSDSNPPGATFSLHAVTKPLIKYLYHRQARELVRTTQGIALSRE